MADGATLAVLIIAHANPGVFHRLVDALDHPDITIFCHIDAKSDLALFDTHEARRIVFIADRASVHWGGYSMIEAELALFRAARDAGPFSAYCLVSGDSLPLLGNEPLLALLTRLPHTLRFTEQLPGDKSYARIERTYLPDTSIGSFNKPGTHLDRHLAFEDFGLVRRAMAVRRLKRSRTFGLFKGPQWFSASDAVLARMLAYVDTDPSYEEIFRFSAIPDELFFHSLLRIIEPEAASSFGIMGADWSRKPMPFVHRADSDLDMVLKSGCVFYRKFSDSGLVVEKVLARRLSMEQAIAVASGPVARHLHATRTKAGEQVRVFIQADESGEPEPFH